MYQVFAVNPKFDNRDSIVGSTLTAVSPKYTLKATADLYAKKLAIAEHEQSQTWFCVKKVD